MKRMQSCGLEAVRAAAHASEKPPLLDDRERTLALEPDDTACFLAGRHVMRVVVLKSPKRTSLNLDYVRFVAKREPKKIASFIPIPSLRPQTIE